MLCLQCASKLPLCANALKPLGSLWTPLSAGTLSLYTAWSSMAFEGQALHAIVSHEVAPLSDQIAAVLTLNPCVIQFHVSFRVAHE